MGNEQGIFRDTRERSTKALLRDALLLNKPLLLREGIMKVQKEHTQESMKSKKESKHGVSGQKELQDLLLAYLTSELKLDRTQASTLPTSSVLETDMSYPKTPLMHALDFSFTELAHTIKSEISKASKKKQHVASDEERTAGGFDRSELAKQRLIANRDDRTYKKKGVTARPIVSSNGLELSEEEKKQMAKFSGLSLPSKIKDEQND